MARGWMDVEGGRESDNPQLVLMGAHYKAPLSTSGRRSRHRTTNGCGQSVVVDSGRQ